MNQALPALSLCSFSSLLAMAALARISRKALTSCPASAAQQQSLLHRAFSTEAAKAIRPLDDRVKWDCRGQRKIVPLGQWLPKVAVDAYVSPNVVLDGQINVCDGGSVLRGDLNKITVGFCSNVQERCVIHSAWSSPTGVSTTGNNDRKCFNTASFWLHNHRQTNTLAFNRIGSRAFSTASVESTVPREIRAAESKPIGAAKKLISFTLLPNLALFWHINEGIEEILADYVHQEMTRNLILINLRLFLIILAKDVFLSLV